MADAAPPSFSASLKLEVDDTSLGASLRIDVESFLPSSSVLEPPLRSAADEDELIALVPAAPSPPTVPQDISDHDHVLEKDLGDRPHTPPPPPLSFSASLRFDVDDASLGASLRIDVESFILHGSEPPLLSGASTNNPSPRSPPLPRSAPLVPPIYTNGEAADAATTSDRMRPAATAPNHPPQRVPPDVATTYLGTPGAAAGTAPGSPRGPAPPKTPPKPRTEVAPHPRLLAQAGAGETAAPGARSEARPLTPRSPRTGTSTSARVSITPGAVRVVHQPAEQPPITPPMQPYTARLARTKRIYGKPGMDPAVAFAKTTAAMQQQQQQTSRPATAAAAAATTTSTAAASITSQPTTPRTPHRPHAPRPETTPARTRASASSPRGAAAASARAAASSASSGRPEAAETSNMFGALPPVPSPRPFSPRSPRSPLSENEAALAASKAAREWGKAAAKKAIEKQTELRREQTRLREARWDNDAATCDEARSRLRMLFGLGGADAFERNRRVGTGGLKKVVVEEDPEEVVQAGYKAPTLDLTNM